MIACIFTSIQLTLDHISQVFRHADFIPFETVHLDLAWLLTVTAVAMVGKANQERKTKLLMERICEHPPQNFLVDIIAIYSEQEVLFDVGSGTWTPIARVYCWGCSLVVGIIGNAGRCVKHVALA